MEHHYPVVEEGANATPLKLFVGQVPKDMDEEQLRPLFEQAGPIAHIMVIRDRLTDAHRGCAFLTYQTREAGERAVEKFHNKVKLPNAHNPVQVRPADSQIGNERLGPHGRLGGPPMADRENKLFVGMLPHDADDMTLTEVFSRFGEVTEIYCMRNADGTPKGCAFVKFSTRAAAIAAIEALHEKCTMEGATRALVVKFADVKRPHTAKGWMVPDLGRGGSVGYGGHGGGMRYGGGVGGYWQATAPVGGRDLYGKGREIYPDFGNRGYPYQYPMGGGYAQSYGPPEYQPHHAQAPRGHGEQHGGYMSYANASQFNPNSASGVGRGDRSLSPSSAAGERSQTFSSPQGGAIPGMRGIGRDRDHGGGARPQEGPPGANLFIYHLPNDLTDADLATAFEPFGHVVSAKVFLDKRTGESKGFGFVSYNHPAEAEVAIGEMNGFQIGSKRLKVQHKKSDHGDSRDPDGQLRYPSHNHHGHHGGLRDVHQQQHQQQHATPPPQQQQPHNMAPLHGGSGRLGMGYSGGGGGHPEAPPELRGYHSLPGDSSSSSSSKVMYTGGGDTRTIYAGGGAPSSCYDAGTVGHGGLPDDPSGAGYRVNLKPKPMGHQHSSAGASAGPASGGGVEDGEGGNGAAQAGGGGGMYHAEGGAADNEGGGL